MHTLSLIFPDTTTCNNLIIQDGSSYNLEFPITNTILEVKLPESCCFISLTLDAGWCATVLDCVDLNTCADKYNCIGLPDGNYEIRFSVDPNLNSMVEYNYFRICQLWNIYIKKVCQLRVTKCDFTIKEYKKHLDKLYYIRSMILDSKILAEECLDVDAAYELYNEAKTLLNESKGCPSCE